MSGQSTEKDYAWHAAVVLDSEEAVTACVCGLQVGARPGLTTLFALFAREHARALAGAVR